MHWSCAASDLGKSRAGSTPLGRRVKDLEVHKVEDDHDQVSELAIYMLTFQQVVLGHPLTGEPGSLAYISIQACRLEHHVSALVVMLPEMVTRRMAVPCVTQLGGPLAASWRTEERQVLIMGDLDSPSWALAT